MYNRKKFIQLGGGAALGLLLSSCANGGNSKDNAKDSANSNTGGAADNVTKNIIGIQLYSLRDDLPKDPKGVLQQLASFGYKQIESYEGKEGMFWGMGNKGFKDYVQGLGMTIVSSHCDYKKDFEKKAAEAAEIGMKYLICPWLGKQKTLDDYKKAAEEFNKAGEICKKNGIRFAYHNHDYSFREQEGQFPQDIMMNNTDASIVDFEMDMYWVVTAGQDPVAWLEKHKNRFKLCHVKDRKKDTPYKEGEPNVSCIVGQGAIDYKTILPKAKSLGMEYYILEQEAYEKTPLECVKEGATYLTSITI